MLHLYLAFFVLLFIASGFFVFPVLRTVTASVVTKSVYVISIFCCLSVITMALYAYLGNGRLCWQSHQLQVGAQRFEQYLQHTQVPYAGMAKDKLAFELQLITQLQQVLSAHPHQKRAQYLLARLYLATGQQASRKR